jgi:colicin import membrane protein
MKRNRSRDRLGDEFYTTDRSQRPDPYDLTDAGLLALITPTDPSQAVDSEDDDAFEALRDDLSPGEAQRVLDTMRPLSKAERKILDEVPDLDDLTRVDDAEQETWLLNRSREGYRAMDTVLDDAVYGDTMTNEEKLERLGLDTDLGWGIPGLSSIKKLATAPMSIASKVTRRLPGGKYLGRALTAPMSAAKWAGKKTLGTVMKFVPGRDAGKAKLVKGAFQKLVTQHANWLGIQDKQAGRTVRPASYYQQLSRPWAITQLKQAGLPTSVNVSGADALGVDILGADVMGSWYNPLSWFSNLVDVMLHGRATQQMSPTGPDGGQPPMVDEYGNPINPQDATMPDGSYPQQDTYPQDAYPQETYPQDAPMEAYPDGGYPDAYAQGDILCGISGDDSLGALATEILSGIATPASKQPAAPANKQDQMMALAVKKLRSGYPIKPGELAIIATLAKGGHPLAKQVYATLLSSGVTKIPGSSMKGQASDSSDDSGAWMQKLNPFYWFKSSEERRLKDAEIDKWKANAELQKQIAKRQEVLSQAEKTAAAAVAVKAAQQQAAATESQLKAIEASITGVLVNPAAGSDNASTGHEKPTEISKVVAAALAKAGKKDRAQELYAKILAGQSLSTPELADAKIIAKILHKVKVVHGDLYEKTPSYLTALHGAFVGGCMKGGITMAIQKNKICGKAAQVLGEKIAAGKPVTPADVKSISAIANRTEALQSAVRSHVTGKAFGKLDKAAELRRAIVSGAAASMTPAEAKMLVAMKSLAKAGNPRAIEALKRLQASGAIIGGDFVGFSLTDAFKYATAPVWYPAQQLGKGAKWLGQKTGIVSKGSASPEQQRLSKGSASPEQQRLNMMRAAAQRRKAAEAKAAAADAQTLAEMRAQEAIAASADAEADAADAAALAQEAAMRTKEIEADPSQYQADDESGSFVGKWESFVGAAEKPLVAKAKSKDAAGVKLRAGAALYSKAKAGDPVAKEAIVTMVAKANKGDQQARRDVLAVKAGMMATKAKQKAQKRQAKVLAVKARSAKVQAFQRKAEAAVATKLVRMERKHELHKLAKIERKSASGNKSARAYVQKQVTLAQKGDKKASAKVAKLKLVKSVRLAAPTKRERRNIASANKLLAHAQKGNPKAVRQIKVLEAAASKGNPNAKRAVKRLQVAKAVSATIATGAAVAIATKKGKKKLSRQEAQKQVASAKAKAVTKSASREELAAGARAAQALGDKETAGKLAVLAATTPAATETLKKTATVVAAKEAGNPEAKAAIESSFTEAKAGNPAEIKKMGNVVAAQTIDDIQKGQPVSPAMRDAVNLQERVAAKDPAAIEEVKQITEAATTESPIPEATAAAITLAAAAVTAKAMASKPQARKEFMEKVNPPLPPAEQTEANKELDRYSKEAAEGTITAEEGVVAIRLAERLNQPKVAAQIAAYAPPSPPTTPMSSLPDMPQPPITGLGSLLWESLRALTFTTRDPLANWREGVSSRAQATPVAVSTRKTKIKSKVVAKVTGCDDSIGWSPFDWFRKNLALIMPSTALAASAASLVTAISAKKQAGRPAPAATPTPVPAAAVPAAEVKKNAISEVPVSSSGVDVPSAAKDELKDAYNNLLAKLSSKKTTSSHKYFDTIDQIDKQALSGDKTAIHKKSIKAALTIISKAYEGQPIDEAPSWYGPVLTDYVRVKKGKQDAINRSKEKLRLAYKGNNLDALNYATWFLGLNEIDQILKDRPLGKKIVDLMLFSATKAPESVLGSEKTLKDYVSEAIALKKISKRDFNRAIESQTGTSATAQTKTAVGLKVIEFLNKKGVKIET